MKNILLYLLTFSFCVTKAQTNKIIPPSPESAQLGKYIEVPVEISNGIPHITLPLFNISNSEISIPLSLSYHAGGIKVEEVASNVGLGWTLFAGGKITRIVKDKPDDLPIKGFIYNILPNYSDAYNKIVHDKLDVEADTYVFNFLNYAGEFSYNKSSNTFVQFPSSDIKIATVLKNETIEGFILSTPDGYQYYFGKNKNHTYNAVNNFEYCVNYKQDKNLSISTENEDAAYIHTWHLTDIITPNKKNAKFLYESPAATEQMIRCSQSISYSSSSSNLTNLKPVTNFQLTYGSEAYLKRIEMDNQTLDLIYSDVERKDLKGGRSLSEIRLSRGNNNYSSINFIYTYLSSSPIDNQFINSFGNHYTKRMQLNEVIFSDWSNNIKKNVNKYSFTYNNTPLPNRFSFAQDYWGYYNGAFNNSLIPEYHLGVNIVTPTSEAAVRSVNPNFSNAGILEKITYPTGGTTEFTYENNIAQEVGFNDENRINNLKNYSETKEISFVKSEAYKIGFDQYETVFEIKNNVGLITINTIISNCGAIASLDCGFMVNIKNINNNSVSYNLFTGEKKLNLPNGVYKLTSFDMDPTNSNNNFLVEIKWNEDISLKLGGMYVGGLRIKRIQQNALSNNPITTDYFYDSDEKDLYSVSGYKSSGIVVSAPVLHIDAISGNQIFHKIISNSNYPSINIGKSKTYYSKVTELVGGEKKTEYYFDSVGLIESNIGENAVFFCDFIGGGGLTNGISDLFKNLKPDFFTERRGKLLEKKEYKYISSGNYELVRKEVLTYNEIKNNIINNFSLKIDLGYSNSDCIPLRYYYYPQRTNFYHLSSKVTEHYFNGSKILNTKVFYNFNGIDNFQLSSQSTVDSDYKVHIIDHQYAHEKSNQYLVDRNMVGIPLRTTVTKSDNGTTKTISDTELLYPASQSDADHRTGGLAVPYALVSHDLKSGDAVTEATYDRYDERGNLQQYTVKSGLPTAVVWGYGGTQPIAKVEGARYTDIDVALISSIVSASDADDSDPTQEPALITALDRFRRDPRLSGYQITTYTYDPLVGVTSITPPSGVREYYHYDAGNRLDRVTDLGGNILKEYRYNYKH